MQTQNITVKILHDDSAESPRQWSNLGTMVCWHKRYSLGDEQPKQDPDEFLKELPKGSIVLPLYLYDHGGITMRTSRFSCPWDSSQVGYIYITPEKIRKEYSVKRITKKLREKIETYLAQEVKTYDDYLTGNTWGYIVESEDSSMEDSCWGFFGDDALVSIKDHISKDLHSLVDEAWENRT